VQLRLRGGGVVLLGTGAVGAKLVATETVLAHVGAGAFARLDVSDPERPVLTRR